MNTRNEMTGIHREPISGVNARIDPAPPFAALSAPSFVMSASMPPTARTAKYASTITMPIFSTNWNRSVTSTPHRPASVEMNAVMNIRTNTMPSASILPLKTIPIHVNPVKLKIVMRILTIARLPQPRMMQLIGRPR